MNTKDELVLLDLLRDCIQKGMTDNAISIIKEKQMKSSIDFSVPLKKLQEGNTDCALTVINHEMKNVGIKLSTEIQAPMPRAS